MRVAIIGCGGIGQKRARALGENQVLIAVADLDPDRARALAQGHPGATVHRDWREIVSRSDVEAVVVATPNGHLAEITLAAVEAGKHVLVEKPAARNASELREVIAATRAHHVCVQVGFNHRYHPAFLKVRALVGEGVLGPLLFVRGRYGHGGRVGYEREWRAQAAISGGGELIDQGVHLIDLSRWFLGDFEHVGGFIRTYYWNMEVEDNAFLALRTRKDQMAWLHASCTEWKNLFSFEIVGRDGKAQVDGLGGSYGVERLSLYRMAPQMGPPETTIWEYPGEDQSWKREFDAFVRAVREGKPAPVGLEEAMSALGIVEKIYAEARCDHLA